MGSWKENGKRSHDLRPRSSPSMEKKRKRSRDGSKDSLLLSPSQHQKEFTGRKSFLEYSKPFRGTRPSSSSSSQKSHKRLQHGVQDSAKRKQEKELTGRKKHGVLHCSPPPPPPSSQEKHKSSQHRLQDSQLLTPLKSTKKKLASHGKEFTRPSFVESSGKRHYSPPSSQKKPEHSQHKFQGSAAPSPYRSIKGMLAVRDKEFTRTSPPESGNSFHNKCSQSGFEDCTFLSSFESAKSKLTFEDEEFKGTSLLTSRPMDHSLSSGKHAGREESLLQHAGLPSRDRTSKADYPLEGFEEFYENQMRKAKENLSQRDRRSKLFLLSKDERGLQTYKKMVKAAESSGFPTKCQGHAIRPIRPTTGSLPTVLSNSSNNVDNTNSKAAVIEGQVRGSRTSPHNKRLNQLILEYERTKSRLFDRAVMETYFAKSKSQFDKGKMLAAFTPLSKKDDEQVDDALKDTDRSKVLVSHEKSGIDITRGTMQCLLPGVWLNDEVINLYVELLKERELSNPNRFLRCHFFNTFFYNKLYKDKQCYDFKAVRRWTTQKKFGYSLLDCDKIFVPIHKDIHWCIVVINIREKKFEYLDSLKGRDRIVLDVLAKYIVDEAKDKLGKDIDVTTWKRVFPDDIPEQLNGYDCGMFMVKYVDFHSRGVKPTFSQEHMGYLRRRMVVELLQLKAK